jgi:hypothetical protein
MILTACLQDREMRGPCTAEYQSNAWIMVTKMGKWALLLIFGKDLSRPERHQIEHKSYRGLPGSAATLSAKIYDASTSGLILNEEPI